MSKAGPDQGQLERFRRAALRMECDEDERRWEERLRELVLREPKRRRDERG